MRIYLLITILAFATLFPVPSKASLINDEVTFTLVQDEEVIVFGPENTIVGPGGEFSVPEFNFEIDFDESSILVNLTSAIGGSPQLEFFFTNLNWTDFPDGTIQDATLTVFQGPEDAFSISFLDDRVTVSNDEFGDSLVAGDYFQVDIVADHGDPIPEPTSIFIFGIMVSSGAGYLGLRLRKRRFSAN